MRLLLALVVFTASVSAQSWQLILPKQAFTMQVNPQDPQKLIVGNWANQMLRSDDGGLTWETKELGSTSVVSYVTSLHWSSADTNVIVGAGFVFAGIKRSTDGGTTWEQVLLDTNQNRMWYISDAVIEDPSNPSTLYAARGTTYNTIYRSSDVGATWDSISVIDPTLTGRLCTITARPDSTNILYVGAQGGLMFRSDDAGLN
ncbi:MAG: WD40/YVTN/BNR-like repeat-containing protein, partial [Candidatus Kapaibacteriota bacterium]